MALIRCPDCGHQVSDRAPSCPQCARPVGTFPEARVDPPPVVRRPAPDAVLPSVDPGMLARGKQLLVTGNADGSIKQCAECGEDVTHDMFRSKSDRGYLCAECEDEELDRAWNRRQTWQKWVRAIFLVFVLGTVLFGVMSAATTFTEQKGPVKKR